MSCIFLCSLTYQVVVFQASLWSQRGWEGLVPGSAHKGGDTGNGREYGDTFKLGAKTTEDEQGQAGRAVGGIRPGEQVLVLQSWFHAGPLPSLLVLPHPSEFHSGSVSPMTVETETFLDLIL